MSDELKPLDIKKERSDFETCMRAEKPLFPLAFNNAIGEYKSPGTQHRWEAWLMAKRAVAVAPKESLQNWLNVVHDNELSLGDRLQRISSAISSLLRGDAPDKYPPHTIREQCKCALDYELVLANHSRLVRELDVLLNGEEGAAKQASLCDIVAQVKREGLKLDTSSKVSSVTKRHT